MTVAAVIFDWGGTLTPWHNVDVLAGWRAAATLLDPDRADHVAALLDAAEREAWRRAETEHRSATVHEIVQAAGLAAEAGLLEPALDAYLEFWEPHTLIDPDAPVVFQSLHERGIKIGVLSNTHWPRTWHERIFDRDGMLALIDGSVYTSEIPWTKPHPAAFRAALDAVEVDDPARAVFVGDRPFDDIFGAQRAGLRAVLVPHSTVPHYDVEPDAVASRLADVVSIVDGWGVTPTGPAAPGPAADGWLD